MLDESEIINKFFNKPLNQNSKISLGIGDDAALLRVPENYELATSIDTLNEGVHFLPETPAIDVGYKSLAVSLSDMAAMGAEPVASLLSLTLPNVDEAWLSAFSQGFFECLKIHQLELMGGNISRGPLAISTVVFGYVPKNKALLRSGAKPDDFIYVTGTLGDAGLALQRQLEKHTVEDALLQRLNRPTPRVEIGMKLRDIASSVIDISDGLVTDLKKILEASHVGAVINTEKIPRSEWMKALCSKTRSYELALTSGEDYELCFTIPPHKQKLLNESLKSFEGFFHCIGQIQKSTGMEIHNEQGQTVKLARNGYDHFASFQ